LTDLVDRLAQHKTLGAAPRAELEWLVAHGSLRDVPEGVVLSPKGEQVTGMFIVLEGHLAIFVDRGAGRHKIIEWRTGDVAGMLPYSRLHTPPGDSIALAPTTVLAVPRECFRDMTRECHTVTSILVGKMVDRARLFTSSDLHDEKMVSLGKLSAGLAHELNNPASAIARNASLLEDRLEDSARATRALGASKLTDTQHAAIDAVRDACTTNRAPGVLSPIEQADREDTFADWLSEHGVDPNLAGPLGETSVTVDGLDALARTVSGAHLEAVLRWAAADCTVRGLTSEIRDAAMRISGLVDAIKGFTHMDQASFAEPVDLALSVRNTVAVLNAKARSKSVAIGVIVPPDLPRVLGFWGELNQILANLIDNALDAVPDGGRVDVTAARDKDRVVVRVIDNGAGIPENVRARMFDPFFTTKPLGQGTGLGLDIVRRLVGHNDGEMDVESQPGRTEFRVSLPIADTPAAGAQS
jgi:signal transduction histidine kinase